MGRLVLALICLTTGLLPSCGGSGDDTYASGGIGGTGVTIGTVTDHGSIVVNGVRFDTAAADISIEGVRLGHGDPQARALLPLGLQVVVHGQTTGATTGTAREVDAFYRVQGPLQDIDSSIDADRPVLTVLGQTIYVGSHTTWDVTNAQQLVHDMVLGVSGPVDDDGVIHAGHIALQAEQYMPDNPVYVKGQVRSANTQQQTFRINGLDVDYSAVAAVMAIGVPSARRKAQRVRWP